MADVYVSIGRAGHLSGAGGQQPVLTGAVRTEKITSSASAASGALAANDGDIAIIFCDTAVIASGVGTATQSNGIYVPGGVRTDIGLAAGAVVSVIDAL